MLGIAVVAFVAVVILLSIPSAISALGIRRHLSEGRSEMSLGRRQLVEGHAHDSLESFRRASADFARASGGARAPWMRALGWVPYVGRTPDAITAVADAGGDTAGAGVELAGAVDQLPDGIGSLAPSGGRVPIDRFAPLAAPLADADRLTGKALTTIRSAPSTMLVGPVGDARREAEDQLVELHRTLAAADRIVAGLPAFLGRDRPARYLFFAQNPAELRGTGGILGAYSILTIDDGVLGFSAFRPVQDLPLPGVEEVPAPSEEFRANYDHYRSTNGLWLNANMTPDFPLAGRALVQTYDYVAGGHLDGAIAADPFAFRALLEQTGPVRVPLVDERIDARTVVAFTTNEAFSRFPDAQTRKLVLGDVAKTVVERFLEGGEGDLARLRALAETMGQGHIQVYTTDPQMQSGLTLTGVGGALPSPPAHDFLSVVQNNDGGNKVDYWEQRSLDYEVALQSDGSVEGTLGVQIHNDAPDHGQPKYVIGPFRAPFSAGENVTFLTAYCGPGCRLREARVNQGPRREVHVGSEIGYRWIQDYLRIPSGDTVHWSAKVSTPGAWQGNSSGGTYHLTMLNQPTIRPTHVHVEIRVPEGMEVRTASDGLQRVGDALVYDGEPGRALELEVEFSPPLLLRWWRNVERPLGRPVVHI